MPTNVFGKGGGGVETLQQVTDAGRSIHASDILTGANYRGLVEKYLEPASSSNLFKEIDVLNSNAQGHVEVEMVYDKTGVTILGDTVTFDAPVIDLVVKVGDYQTALYAILPIFKMYNILLKIEGTPTYDGLYMVIDLNDDGLGGTNNVATVIRIDGTSPSFASTVCVADVLQANDATFLTMLGVLQLPNVTFANSKKFIGQIALGFGDVPAFMSIGDQSAGFIGLCNSPDKPAVVGSNFNPAGSVFGSDFSLSGGDCPQTTGWYMGASMSSLTTGGVFRFVVPAALENWLKFIRFSDKAVVYNLTPYGVYAVFTPNMAVLFEEIKNAGNDVRTLDALGNEAIAGGDSTDGNEFVCEDIIQHVITAGEAGAGSFQEFWTKTSPDLIADIGGMYYSASTFHATPLPTAFTIDYDAANFTVTGILVENDVVTLMVHYQKGLSA